MLLIFGIQVYFRTLWEGEFFCPNCGGDRRCRRRLGRRWLTLFFIPVLPLGNVGQIAECRTCRSRYGTDVLSLPTSQDMVATLQDGMRALVVAVLRASGDSTRTAVRQRGVDAIVGSGTDGYTVADLDGDVGALPDNLPDQLAGVAEQLPVEGRELFLAEGVRVALADGPLAGGERAVLERAGRALNLTPAHTFGVLATVERGATRPDH